MQRKTYQLVRNILLGLIVGSLILLFIVMFRYYLEPGLGSVGELRIGPPIPPTDATGDVQPPDVINGEEVYNPIAPLPEGEPDPTETVPEGTEPLPVEGGVVVPTPGSVSQKTETDSGSVGIGEEICPQVMKQCPNGSFVGYKQGPGCEYEPCPEG